MPGRNEICPCGSGLKYKKCCGGAQAVTSPRAQANAVVKGGSKSTALRPEQLAIPATPLMTHPGESHTAQGGQRACGDCSACCEGWLKTRVLGHDIGLHQPCPFSSGHNCTIHETRPHDPCRVFFCGWAEAGSDLPDRMQPNQSGVIMLTGRSRWRGRPMDVVVSAGRDPDEKLLDWLQRRSIAKMQPFVYQREERWYGFGPVEFQKDMAGKAARGEALWT